ncbi:hypothetical protein Q31b_49240 [Novipirellula aureliae]|uniref:Glycine zipper-like domain-containing protein n=1 Tax=Novipirellula aureliae TaxID=2527966 RepID=A0A5C6DH50_9BACT|nr:hypothetical protein [Novipirellula aureliae]TWU36643.1 hypothetical protein Q31b_49240 [Novipirellula aureliae]
MKTKKNRSIGAQGAGIALGISIGTAIGVATGNLAIWLALGVSLGIVFGSAGRFQNTASDKGGE